MLHESPTDCASLVLPTNGQRCLCEVLADDIFHLTLGNSHDACGQLHGDGCCHNAQGQGGGQEQGQGREAYLQEVRGKRQEARGEQRQEGKR